MLQSSLHLTSIHNDPTPFITGHSNALATKTVLSHWHEAVLLLCGEEGCGKSLLARQWQREHHAHDIQLPLTNYLHTPLQSGKYLLDPLDLKDEVALFHLLNIIKETRSSLLICSRTPAQQLEITLPDLASRLRGARSVSIAPPDDAMLQALFIQQLSVKQLRVEADVVQYALTRLPRSFAAVIACVESLDQQSLERQRAITLPFTREVIQAMNL